MHVGTDPARYIDTSRYRYLSLRTCQEGIQDVGFGWVFRLLWAPQNIGLDHSTSNDFIVEDGWPNYTESSCWQTYKIDMAAIGLEPNSGPNLGWVNTLRVFRFDPTEVPTPARFKVDWIKLTALDKVRRGDVYPIRYALTGTPPLTLSVYYDTDTNPYNGRQFIGSAQVSVPGSSGAAAPVAAAPAGLNSSLPHKTFLPLVFNELCSGNCFNWNTSGVPTGIYYVCLQVEDAYNATYRCSEAPLRVE
jgi:hypothetical protein